MVNLFTAASPLVVAMTIAGVTQAPTPTTGTQLTVVGCVARNGDVDPDKGTRILDIPPNALALTGARVLGGEAGPASAVPGSRPDGRDSGTIPNATITNAPQAPTGTLSFELVGASTPTLADQVGRRVEIIGRVEPQAGPRADNEGTRGTSGTESESREATRGSGPATGTGTREERPGATTAHPSAEFRRLEVISFRNVTGMCE